MKHTHSAKNVRVKRFDARTSNWIFLVVVGVAVLVGVGKSHAATPLKEFAYREFTVNVTGADGRPCPGVLLYGFCPDLNLIWPRRDQEYEGRNDVLWHESFLARTGADGKAKVIVPPGRWGFFAAGQGVGGAMMVAWSDFAERKPGERVELTAKTSKQWNLVGPDEATLSPNRVFVKAMGFPVWIGVERDPTSRKLAVEMSSGRMDVWATGLPSNTQPGFVLGWGGVDDKTPDGPRACFGGTAMIDCSGGAGRAVLRWERLQEFGLAGETTLPTRGKVLVAPGPYTISYKRPMGAALEGDFVGHYYSLKAGEATKLSFDGPLAAGLDHNLSDPDKKGDRKLSARLYLVDSNGHLLAELSDSAGRPADFKAAVIAGGTRIAATHIAGKGAVPGQGEGGQTFFEASIADAVSLTGVMWEFSGPPGILTESRMPESEMVPVATASYSTVVPKALVPHAQNILEQAEVLARNMEKVSGRKRRRGVTNLSVKPGRGGAAGTHGGSFIGIGTKLFYSDTIMARHDMVHEIGHNYDFYHGGLHEMVVETTRCAGAEQVSQQPAKWMFVDRMNGLQRKEVMYPNTGLYLYCYAQRGASFLRFMAVNEKKVGDQLSKSGFSKDEVTTALCGLGLGRDLTEVCLAYGLKVTPDRVNYTSRQARDLAKQVPGK